jgi:hypothetical protein
VLICIKKISLGAKERLGNTGALNSKGGESEIRGRDQISILLQRVLVPPCLIPVATEMIPPWKAWMLLTKKIVVSLHELVVSWKPRGASMDNFSM